MTVTPVVTRQELAGLYGRLFSEPEIDELARYFRNSGFVEKVTIGEMAAQGRVRGKRRDAGFNVRIHFSGTYSCKCPRAKKRACEHVGALLLDVLARMGEAATAGPAASINSREPAPEVYKFLLDLFPGIGPRRAREVARVFRTVPDLLQATPRQFRNLPEIGVWAAQVLHEHLARHQRVGAAARAPVASPTERPPPSTVRPDLEWIGDLQGVLDPNPEASAGRGGPLGGRTVLVQATKAGAVFFRMDQPTDPRVRRVLQEIRADHADAFRPSRKHRVWVSDHESFPRVVFQLEAKGAQREHAKLADLPLDGLTLLHDAAGRRARFQFQTDGLEEAFPLAFELLKKAEGYEYEEHTGHHLVLPREFPRLKSDLSDFGALLIRHRLRPVREIAEWKPEEAEDFGPGTPKLRPLPDLSALLAESFPETLRAHVRLRGYQCDGVAFIRATNYLAYLGDPPGLGKTLQAIVAALYLPGRVLVVAPAGARNVWKKEVESHTTESVFVYRPTSRAKAAKEKFVVASYDALLSRAEDILSVQYDLVILDEAHYVKNKEAERTKAVHEQLRTIPRRLLLSGTPVMNRADEVRKQLEFIYPDEWANEPWFRRRFVQPLVHGTPEVRMAALTRLREYFQGVMLRRQKADVLKDLPPKHAIVERVRLPPAWRKEYDLEAGKLREHVRLHRDTAFGVDYETTRGHVLTLRQLASNGKGEAAEAYVRNILRVPGEKIVVFSYYLQHIETLEKALAEFQPVVVHGGVVDKDRERAVREFQENPDVRVFLGQITAAGTAVTLTAARHCVFVDLDWNPANHEQAGDRIHRISQTREVFQHYLVASGTVDEDVVKLLQQKSTMTSALLDGDEASAGLLQARRENRTIARLALRVAMTGVAEPAPAEPIASE